MCYFSSFLIIIILPYISIHVATAVTTTSVVTYVDCTTSFAIECIAKRDSNNDTIYSTCSQ